MSHPELEPKPNNTAMMEAATRLCIVLKTFGAMWELSPPSMRLYLCDTAMLPRHLTLVPWNGIAMEEQVLFVKRVWRAKLNAAEAA